MPWAGGGECPPEASGKAPCEENLEVKLPRRGGVPNHAFANIYRSFRLAKGAGWASETEGKM